MNTSMHRVAEETARITATQVPAHQRLRFLPRHFGRYLMTVEGRIYDQMGELAAGYTGGYWEMMELSNGGGYLFPTGEPLLIEQPSNDFRGTVSADAAGIIVTLYVLSAMSFQYAEVPLFADHFHWLRAFAIEHAEAAQILAAID